MALQIIFLLFLGNVDTERKMKLTLLLKFLAFWLLEEIRHCSITNKLSYKV